MQYFYGGSGYADDDAVAYIASYRFRELESGRKSQSDEDSNSEDSFSVDVQTSQGQESKDYPVSAKSIADDKDRTHVTFVTDRSSEQEI